MAPTSRNVFRVITGLFFMGAGALHFVHPAPYLKIMPPYIPAPRAMVLISGAAEIAGGAGLLIPLLRRAASWGLVALLIAVFPANLYMAMNGIQITVRPLPEWTLWARIPVQGVLIWWVIRMARE